MARKAYILILSAFALLSEGAEARGLDHRLIHGYYKDGEFDRVIKSLADYGTRCKCTREDSIFAEKHLAVVYAANPGTRELGRYHMFLMLDMVPGSDLLDMFVGEEVDAVFEKVRKEHVLRAVARKPAAGKPTAPIVSRTASKSNSSRPAPRLGSESASHSGVSGSAGAPIPRPAPSPYVKSARALLAGRPYVPVRMASLNGSGVLPASHHLARSLPTVPRSGASPGAASPAVSPPGPARAFPMSAFVPKSAPLAAVSEASQAAAVPSSTPAAIAVTSRPSPPTAAIRSDSTSAWKEAGLWIGGGAALALVAFTLFNSGDDNPSASKTYVVPATASK